MALPGDGNEDSLEYQKKNHENIVKIDP